MVYIPIVAIHYDSNYWPNPEEFNPDRFSDEEIAKRPTNAFLPFGDGPRYCIGSKYAIVNIKFAIATIVKNFKVKIDEKKTKIPLTFDPKITLMYPNGGCWVKFEKINKSD
jgi:cytochrome P450 family 6